MRIIVLFTITFLFVFLLACKDKVESPPNVIIIFTDDQGYQDVGCFGSPDILTPHLDQLAQDGARLTDFSVAQPVCSASRAALLTGCYPNRIGLWGALMPQSKMGLHSDEVTIAEILQQQGYATGAFGKWHLGNMEKFGPLQNGFDEYFGIPYSNDMWPNHPWQGSVFDFPPLPLYDGVEVIDTLDDQSSLTTDITERVVSFIEKNKDRPFFAYVPHPQPHVPLFVSDKFRGKSKRGLYGDVIMEIDWSLGEIVGALEQHGISEQTIVIFTSDNGPWLSYGSHAGAALPLREGKGTAWEGGVREPFIIKYPKGIKSGQVIHTPVMSIDLLPSIAHVTGAALPKNKIDGLNVWKVMTGESTENPHEAYFYYYHKNELHAVRKGQWKLYFPHKYRTVEGKGYALDGVPIDYDYVTLDQLELYNLENDIGEELNVINQYPEVSKELQLLAESIRVELGDELKDVAGTEKRMAGKL